MAWRWLARHAIVALIGANVAGDPAPPQAFLKPKSELDSLAHDVHITSARASTAASDARAVAAEAAARTVTENAITTEYTSNLLASRTEMQEPYMKNVQAEATSQKQMALVAEKGAENGFNSAVLMQKEAIKDATAWATGETDKRLADPIRKLQEWKMAVLHDPDMEAKKAAQKAASPYMHSIAQIHKQILEYQQRAEDLQSQGYELQRNGLADAKKAVKKQAKRPGPNLKLAQKLMNKAHKEMIEGTMFIDQAKKVWKMASDLYENWQAYHDEAMAAAAGAAHRYAPNLYAPPCTGGAALFGYGTDPLPEKPAEFKNVLAQLGSATAPAPVGPHRGS